LFSYPLQNGFAKPSRSPRNISASGAAEFSPWRKPWVPHPHKIKRQRRDTFFTSLESTK
jgi:hypothetical protein